MLKLTQTPEVDIESLTLEWKDLSFANKVKTFFDPKSNQLKNCKGRTIYKDVLIEDLDGVLEIDQKIPMIFATLQSKPNRDGVVSYTVYEIHGVIPYAIMNGCKLCSVDFFEINVDKSWKSY